MQQVKETPLTNTVYWSGPLYRVLKGTNRIGEVYSLWQHSYMNGSEPDAFEDPKYIKSWTINEYTTPDFCLDSEIANEVMLNDWSRWNTGLPIGQKIEVSETVYYHLLECLPPHKMEKGGYFEVGEPHHHDNNGKAIYRACWMEDGNYYTGYPKP